MEDPAFAAIERAYLAELARMNLRPDAVESILHRECLDQAIYEADRTNGGLRFKKLDGAVELEARLLRALSNRLRE